jgi:hypothetical protein
MAHWLVLLLWQGQGDGRYFLCVANGARYGER